MYQYDKEQYGDMLFTMYYKDNGIELEVVWRGGPYTQISGDIIKEIFNPNNCLTNGRSIGSIPCRRSNNYLNIGPYKLRIIQYDKDKNCYIAKRIN